MTPAALLHARRTAALIFQTTLGMRILENES
jgi:hypothetical protein